MLLIILAWKDGNNNIVRSDRILAGSCTHVLLIATHIDPAVWIVLHPRESIALTTSITPKSEALKQWLVKKPFIRWLAKLVLQSALYAVLKLLWDILVS